MNVCFIILSFLTSLTSLAYYLIFSGELAEVSGNETLAQSFGLGSFLSGIAGGSVWFEKKSLHINTSLKKINYLIKTEFLISFIGGIMPTLISSFFLFYLLLLNKDVAAPYEIPLVVIFFVHLPIYFILGFFSGLQLPLLLKWKDKIENKILVINYSGALAAGLLINQFSSQGIPLHLQIGFILVLNGVNILALCWMKKSKNLIGLGIVIIVILINVKITPEIKKRELAAYYLGVKIRSLREWPSFEKSIKNLGKIERRYGPYQKIDLVSEYPNRKILFGGNQTLYLNYRPQFDLYTYKTYHESMLEGALNLSSKKPRKVLILGGGDGLLLNLVLRKEYIKQVTLVEIDPIVLELAQNHPILTHLNQFVFRKQDPRFSLIVGDAISFLRKKSQKYDAIFIDFPYPYSDELKKLYSLEFYQMVKSHLEDDGFFILDFPILVGEESHQEKIPLSYCFIKTLDKIGLKNTKFFGPYAPFIFVSFSEDKIEFRYPLLPKDLRLSTYLNLVELEKKGIDSDCFFSMFSKRTFN